MNKSIAQLIPKYIRDLQPYVPGKPIEEVERELKLRAVKLASNENPLGPSPLAIRAAQAALADANRYPDGGGYYLREKLAARWGVPADNLILGDGSTELIDLAARSLLHPGDEGATCEGSFPMYSISTRATGAGLVMAPLREYVFDLDELARAVTPRTKLIFLANPNNPTGTMFTAAQLEQFLDRLPEHLVVVLDEAYYEYVDRPDYSRSLELVRAGRSLLVLRTFSKVYGLAGLRIGYGIGPAELLAEINKVRSPFNTSGVAQAAALAALDDHEHVRRSLESNRAGLEQLRRGLAAMGVRYVPSVTNFLLVELGTDAQPVAERLLSRGVIVRPMRWMGFPSAVRATIGTAEENEKFLAELARALPSPVGGPASTAGKPGMGR
jgi:histidinol-phosphate aminotransferase